MARRRRRGDVAALALLVGLHRGAAGETFRRPGGETIELLPWELVREDSQRHEACNLKVLDAASPDFAESWFQSFHEPVLIQNLLGHWKARESMTPEWFRKDFTKALKPTVIRPWNFTEPLNPQCLDCDWTQRWGGVLNRQTNDYFDMWNARAQKGADGVVELKESNAIIFDASYACDELDEFAPTPVIFAPFCGNRHVAFAAYGTSHGLHRHSSAWQAQVSGFKSWWMVPGDVYTKPVDLTISKSPFGFPHEKSVQQVNSLCGYTPSVPEVRDRVVNCVQGPGETMYVPNDWWHGTCSLNDFAIGLGGGLYQKDKISIRFHNRVPADVVILFVLGDEEKHVRDCDANAVMLVEAQIMSDPVGHLFRFRRADNREILGEFLAPHGLGSSGTPYDYHIMPPGKSASPEL